MKIIFTPGDALFLCFVSLLCYIVYDYDQNSKYISSLQTGERVLKCELRDTINGRVVIEPSKIVGVDIDTHTFFFTNGSATNCEVSERQ